MTIRFVRKRFCGRAAALALLPAALAATAPPAAAADKVSNFSNPSTEPYMTVGSSPAFRYRVANSFTTGSNTGGYGLNNIKLKFGPRAGAPAFIQVWLHSASGGKPGAQLKKLSGASSPNGSASGSSFTYTSSPAWRLEPQTEYSVVLKAPTAIGGHNYYVVHDSDSADQTSDDGWSIGDKAAIAQGSFFLSPWQIGATPLVLSVDADALSVSLTAGAPTATGNTLTIANYTKAWHYKYTTPSGDESCTQVAAGVSTATATGLSHSTSYTFKAYKDSSCATELTTDATDAEFTTLTPSLSASGAEATTARLAISDWPHA